MQKKEKIRCACYTRKSVEDGLEQEFNSLDAQREACESFIASQKSNGWVCLPKRYDDGGFSGGNIERPALRELLEDCEAGKVDMIIIYKIDRLSRSICDFADLMKRFDKWGVEFVSVTQDINTSTSAGRMMLNILITFAQFEREVITERVRDKMAASRLKGKWVGGVTPIGYKVVDKKLVVDEDFREVVKMIFNRYIEVQSPKLISNELNDQGFTKPNGAQWETLGICRMLANHTYVGEVKYKDQVVKGEQEAIISREVWDRVQEIKKANDHVVDHSHVNTTIAPLRGILRCGHCGGAMIPIFSDRNNKKYFYYACYKARQARSKDCPIRAIQAGEVEELVKRQICKMLGDLNLTSMLAQESGLDVSDIVECFKEEFWKEISPGEYNRLLTILIKQAVLYEDKFEIEFNTCGVKSLIEELKHE